MCGIAGQVDFGGPGGPSPPDAMFGALSCRGPDANGRWSDGIATLGHSRLAIRDLDSGLQPHLATIDGRDFVVVFGGEIYNSARLALHLQTLGHDLTESTEVCIIAHAFAEWGLAFCERLVGMFSIAVWSVADRTLTLARDRLGIKPLHFARCGRTSLFASEPKSILVHPLSSRRVTTTGFNEMLAFNLGLPGCPWEDVDEVPPGHVVVIGEGGSTTHRYWQLQPSRHPARRRLAGLRELFSTVVADHLASDIPFGVLLSGGLDSTAIVAAAVRHVSGAGLRTFSLHLSDSDFVSDFERSQPDDAYALLAADALGTDHVVVQLTATELNEPARRAAVVRAYDAPPGSGDRDRTMTALFAEVKRSRSVVLSGEGADELFDGYSWAHDSRKRGTALFPWVSACQDKYGLVREMFATGLWNKLGFEAYLEERCLDARRSVPTIDGERRSSTATSATEERLLHLSHLLPVLLARKDRLSMLNGLEVRVPYCDHRLVEFAAALPRPGLRLPGDEKRFLRDATKGLVPEPIRRRPKSAYPAASGETHCRAVAASCRQLLEAPPGQAAELLSFYWLDRAAAAVELGSTNDLQRAEWALNFATWVDLYHPRFDL